MEGAIPVSSGSFQNSPKSLRPLGKEAFTPGGPHPRLQEQGKERLGNSGLPIQQPYLKCFLIHIALTDYPYAYYEFFLIHFSMIPEPANSASSKDEGSPTPA